MALIVCAIQSKLSNIPVPNLKKKLNNNENALVRLSVKIDNPYMSPLLILNGLQIVLDSIFAIIVVFQDTVKFFWF